MTRLLELTLPTAAENLAIDEALLEFVDQADDADYDREDAVAHTCGDRADAQHHGCDGKTLGQFSAWAAGAGHAGLGRHLLRGHLLGRSGLIGNL